MKFIFENKKLNEKVDIKTKRDIFDYLNSTSLGWGPNLPAFASYVAEHFGGLDREDVVDVVAGVPGYDVYKTNSGFFADEDYVICYEGDDPWEIYKTTKENYDNSYFANGLDDEYETMDDYEFEEYADELMRETIKLEKI